jgi:lipopolysaccharide biosynthesis glycosyltransferase
MTKDAIHIVCVTDENYIPHCAALLKSIERNHANDFIHVHIIHDSVPDHLIRIVKSNNSKLKIDWHSVGEHPALTLPPLLQISRATYLRLIMDEILDQSIARVIYLDIDMIVTGSLRDLWELNLGDRLCAAVIDPGVPTEAFAGKYGLSGPGAYFNAGMILFDMQKIRTDAILSDALNRLLSDRGNYEYADQDALNIILWGKWLQVDPTWNFQRKFLYIEFPYNSSFRDRRGDPRIIHFTESMKPWQAQEWHPLAWLYWKYLLATPFARAMMRKEKISPIRILKYWMKYTFRQRPVAG